MMTYEVWETESGNLMASYDSEERALQVLATYATRHGEQSVVSLALVRVDCDDEDGAMETVASGADLLERIKVAA